jgi:predicted HTH transcriptional regulator
MLIKKNSSITRNDIAKNLNLSSETIKEYLGKLKNKEVIERIGEKKEGYWKIFK